MGRTDHFRKPRTTNSSSTSYLNRRPGPGPKRRRRAISPPPPPPIAPPRHTTFTRIKNIIKSSLTTLRILPAPTAAETEAASFASRVLASLEEEWVLHCRIEFATANKLRTELEERNRQLRWLACRVIALERKLFVEGRQKVWRPTGIKGRGEPTNEGTAGRVMFVLSEELEMPHPAGDMGWEMAFNPEKGVYMWMKREKVEAIPLSAPRMPGEWREEW